MKSYRSIYIGSGFIAGMYKAVCNMPEYKRKYGNSKAKFLTIYDINLLAAIISENYNELVADQEKYSFITMHSGPVLLSGLQDSSAKYVLSPEDANLCVKATSGILFDGYENNNDLQERYEIAKELHLKMSANNCFMVYKKQIEDSFKKLYLRKEWLRDFYGKDYEKNEDFNEPEKRKMHLMANFYYIDDEFLKKAGCNRNISLSKDIIPIFKRYVENYPFYKLTALSPNIKLEKLKNFINGGVNTCWINESALYQAVVSAVVKYNGLGLYKNNNKKWLEVEALRDEMDALTQEVD